MHVCCPKRISCVFFLGCTIFRHILQQFCCTALRTITPNHASLESQRFIASSKSPSVNGTSVIRAVCKHEPNIFFLGTYCLLNISTTSQQSQYCVFICFAPSPYPSLEIHLSHTHYFLYIYVISSILGWKICSVTLLQWKPLFSTCVCRQHAVYGRSGWSRRSLRTIQLPPCTHSTYIRYISVADPLCTYRIQTQISLCSLITQNTIDTGPEVPRAAGRKHVEAHTTQTRGIAGGSRDAPAPGEGGEGAVHEACSVTYLRRKGKGYRR